MTTSKPSASRQVELPPGTRQGPTSWFTVKLRATVTFKAGDASRGTAQLLATTNGKGAALVTFRATDEGVRVFHTGYLGGPVNVIARQRVVSLNYENYVQLSGIAGGQNDLRITIDGPQLVDRVVIHRQTGLHRTSAHPEQLSIIAPDQLAGRVGQPFTVPFSVRRRGDRPDRPVTVSINKAGGPVTMQPADVGFTSVEAGREGHFTGTATEPGRYEVKLTAEGGYNEPLQIVTVTVSEPEKSSRWRRAAAAVLFLTGAVVLLANRRRSTMKRTRDSS